MQCEHDSKRQEKADHLGVAEQQRTYFKGRVTKRGHDGERIGTVGADHHMLEHDQETERADEGQGMLRRVAVFGFHVAICEAFDDQRGDRDDDDRNNDPGDPHIGFAEQAQQGFVTEGQAPCHGRPHHYGRDHEQRGYREVEEVEHPDDQREGDGHHHVKATEHQPVNKLLQ